MNVSILGHCSKCVRSTRTVVFCHINRCHTQEKATCCLQCLYANYSLSKCRVELQHLQPNGTVVVPVGSLNIECTPDILFTPRSSTTRRINTEQYESKAVVYV